MIQSRGYTTRFLTRRSNFGSIQCAISRSIKLLNTNLNRLLSRQALGQLALSALIYCVWAVLSLGLFAASSSVTYAQNVPAVSFAKQVEDLNALFQQIEQAAKSIDYRGSYTLSNGHHIENIQTISVQDGLGFKQKTWSSAYPGIELIRQNQEWYELVLNQPSGTPIAYAVSPIKAQFPAILFTSTDLNKYYRGFQLSESKPLAGRLCTPYSVISIELDRPNWYLCVDEANNLLLERHLIDQSKRLLVYSRFNEVQFGAEVDVAQVQPSLELASHLVKTPDRVSINTQKAGWRFSFPDGFEMISSQQLETGTSPSTIQLVLSDGLSVFSIFIQKLSEQEKLLTINPAMSMQNTAMYAHRVDDYIVMATGMMPMKTLKDVATSATFIPPVVNQ